MSELQNQLYKRAVADRVNRHGELVLHVGSFGQEWVRLHFYDVPHNNDVNGLEITMSDKDPMLHGHVDFFENLPTNRVVKRSGVAPEGSSFVIRGNTYDVQEVDINHRNGIKITLVSDCREGEYPFFFDDQELQECEC